MRPVPASRSVVRAKDGRDEDEETCERVSENGLAAIKSEEEKEVGYITYGCG